MESFWSWVYNRFAVPLIYLVFLAGSLASVKIRKGFKGRKRLFEKLERDMGRLSSQGPRFWIHSSSMGEFEQAKPLIRRLKQRHPESTVVVSLFSPSAFDHIGSYKEADAITYLPFDTLRNARRFLSLVRPNAGILIRHDLWPNHLWQLKKMGKPVVLVNCTIRHSRMLGLSRRLGLLHFLLGCFDKILAVSPEAKTLSTVLGLGEDTIEVVGDTRYDQVVARAHEAEKIVAPLRDLAKKRPCVVLGSTWPSDEDVIFDAMARLGEKVRDLWLVIVPHEPKPDRIEEIEKSLADLSLRFCRFSGIDKVKGDETVLVVDRIGILASLYALGDFCFVGGGFGPGVHNVLEPAALGKAVLFGPRCKNSYEAGQLEKRGVGFIVRDGKDFHRFIVEYFEDAGRFETIGNMAADLVRENVGATDRIVDRLDRLISLI